MRFKQQEKSRKSKGSKGNRDGFFSSYADGSIVPTSQKSNLQQTPENKFKIHKPRCKKEKAFSKLLLLIYKHVCWDAVGLSPWWDETETVLLADFR